MLPGITNKLYHSAMFLSVLPTGHMTVVKKRSSTRIKEIITGRLSSTAKELDDGTPQRVFLYLQLINFENVIQTDNRMLLHLHDTSHLTTQIGISPNEYMSKVYLDKIDFSRPTFAIMLEQDNREHLEAYCDSPIHLTLFERITKSRRLRMETNSDGEEVVFDESDVDGEDGEDKEDQMVAISEGYIDLLEFFSQKRTAKRIKVYLYPTSYGLSAAIFTFSVSNTIPLIKDLKFCNLAFISFESIYNPPQYLLDDSENLIAELSFQTKNPDSEYTKYSLCKFSVFTKSIIKEQNFKLKWETLKSAVLDNYDKLSIFIGDRAGKIKMFSKLLGKDGFNYQYDEISVQDDYALICNSVHRFPISQSLSQLLEESIAFDEYNVLVEFYKSDNPSEIILSGTFELAILLYPNVNSCRFSVHLTSPNPKPPRTSISTTKKQRGTSATAATAATATTATGSIIKPPESEPKPTFAVIKICLLAPITEVPLPLATLTETDPYSQMLKQCTQAQEEKYQMGIEEICEHTYADFEMTIRKTIAYIIKKNIHAKEPLNEALCCQMKVLTDKITRLISCDFNRRLTTKTNIEFTRLLTKVYNELTQRVYDLLSICPKEELGSYFAPLEDPLPKIISLMGIMKYMYESNNQLIAGLIKEKLNRKYINNIDYIFYTFLYNMEKQNYDEVMVYQKRKLSTHLRRGLPFEPIIEFYLTYINGLSVQEEYNEAYQQLIKDLTQFLIREPKRIDVWILLHCLYKENKYLPGMEYTRLMYEDLYTYEQPTLPTIPKTLWSIYNNYEIEFIAPKEIAYYKTLQLFCTIGCYKFAEIIFNELSSICTEAERSLFSKTFQVFAPQILKTRRFSSTVGIYRVGSRKSEKRKSVAPKQTSRSINITDQYYLSALTAQIEGTIYYMNDEIDNAMQCYEKILHMPLPNGKADFQLALLRLSFLRYDMGDYDKAIEILTNLCIIGDNCMPVNFVLGKALYKLDRLPEALKYLNESTKYEFHVPDCWGYLAFINLRLGKTFNALECWKYAMVNPNNTLSDELFEDASKINVDVPLYVDLPINIDAD